VLRGPVRAQALSLIRQSTTTPIVPWRRFLAVANLKPTSKSTPSIPIIDAQWNGLVEATRWRHGDAYEVNVASHNSGPSQYMSAHSVRRFHFRIMEFDVESAWKTNS